MRRRQHRQPPPGRPSRVACPPCRSRSRSCLAEAVRLARDNAEAGQQPFAALVVRDGEIVAAGVNTALRDADPMAHAEVEAIRSGQTTSRERSSSRAASRVRCARPPRPRGRLADRLRGAEGASGSGRLRARPGRGRDARPSALGRQAACPHVDTPDAEEPFERFRSGRSRNPEPRARAARWRRH